MKPARWWWVCFSVVVVGCAVFADETRYREISDRLTEVERAITDQRTMDDLGIVKIYPRQKKPDPWDFSTLVCAFDGGKSRTYTQSDMWGFWKWDQTEKRWKRGGNYLYTHQEAWWFDPSDNPQTSIDTIWKPLKGPSHWIEMMMSDGPEDLRKKISARTKTAWDRIQDARIDSLFSPGSGENQLWSL